MADLKQRADGKTLVQLCSKTRECLVGEENISLDLFRDVVDCTRVAQAEGCSSFLDARIDIEYGVDDTSVTRWWKRWCRDGDCDDRLF